ncbi:MAG: histone deacetylase [Acidobacteriota bacterium]
MVRESRTAFIYHEEYLRHDTGALHLESERRLAAIVEHLKKTGTWERLLHIKPEKADEKWILKIHTLKYLEYVKESCATGAKVLDFADTAVCLESCDIALLAVGGVLAAIDAVMKGIAKNAFCAVRPPGHHAERDRAMGFCLFNNVAIGAKYLQDEHQLKKIAIIDWDVHHGNGTQNSFYEDPMVLYVSLHQYPHYPGTGSHLEKGKGAGEGYTLNFPMPAGSGEELYLKVFEHRIIPALHDFKPDFILISAGFDAHANDPLSNTSLTEESYARMTEFLKRVSQVHCNDRIVSVLEGGYDLIALGSSVEAHLLELMA